MTTQITTNNISNSTLSSIGSPKITSIAIADASYNVLDDTAANTGGGYIVITGANFSANSTVLIDTTTASAVSIIDSTTIRAQVPAKAAASYNIWVISSDGGTAIKVNGLTYSTTPTWVTTSPLTDQAANVTFGINFSATGANTYSVAAGSTLPAGTTLAANGYFSGTVTTINTTTNYTFSIRATDAELQDADKAFTVTVTWSPPVAAYVWGEGGSGLLGLNSATIRSSPTQLGSPVNWSTTTVGASNMASIKVDGTLWTWGRNNEGQLGLNVQGNYRSSPVQVGALTNWSQISLVRYNAAAIKTDGTLWTWGDNNYGGLGINSATNTPPSYPFLERSSPTQLGSGTWSQVSTSDFFVAAIKTDGTLWAWGYNNSGQIGDGTIVNRSSPVQIGSGTTWTQVAAGYSRTAAIKTDGTLWLWGVGTYGTLGNNNSISRSSPVQVGALTNWRSIGLRTAAIATKTDGTLWLWGGSYRNFGMLGNNAGDNTQSANRSSPVQIGTDTNWSISTATGYRVSAAIRTNGTLWTWGMSQGPGNLGQNDNISKSSPTQVGTDTTWSKVWVRPDGTPSWFTIK